MFAVHRFGSAHAVRYRLGLLKDASSILKIAGWNGEVVKFPDLAKVPICSSIYRPKNEISYQFTTDFKWETIGNSRSIEIITIEGFDKKHVFILDVNSTITQCSQWTPRRLFMLDVPKDCVKGKMRIMPKSAFKGDEIEAFRSVYTVPSIQIYWNLNAGFTYLIIIKSELPLKGSKMVCWNISLVG